MLTIGRRQESDGVESVMKVISKKAKRRWDQSPLIVAFISSCIIHLVVFGLWTLGILDMPDQLVRLFVRRRENIAEKSRPDPLNKAAAVPKEIPLTFIEVEPDRAVAQAPKNAKFYSTANTEAANPNPKRETTNPEADGKQSQIARLRDVPRAVLPPPLPPPAPVPTPPPPKPEMTLQPAPPPVAPPPAPVPPVPAPAPKPEIALQPAPSPITPPPAPPVKPPDSEIKPPKPIEIAKVSPPIPDPTAVQTAPRPPPPKERPRSLAEARQQAGLVGQKMKQEGGVRRPGQLSVDARATPFGEYDARMIRAIQDHWYSLMDDNAPMNLRSGRVVLQFNLMFDGRIMDMKVRDSEVGEALSLLCQRAVIEPSQYPRWPLDMHRTVGGNVRPITLTFVYY